MWIARDRDGTLVLFYNKPIRNIQIGRWLNNGVYAYLFVLDPDLFPEVKWEDEEPTEVELVIKEK